MFNHDVLNFRVEKFDLGAFNPKTSKDGWIDPPLDRDWETNLF